ncbi:hypothetical protein GDO78_008544 [Eleutherodactylus coqui]|uniref:Uncharacterized protein n=1 Tax=Eleutherodactylus coqui TaxID=57060 RepID=A0A8J6FDT8_ELECQ|nr:hypothetical protein GDO78_008544 [Eleutherodactylus coqui]
MSMEGLYFPPQTHDSIKNHPFVLHISSLSSFFFLHPPSASRGIRVPFTVWGLLHWLYVSQILGELQIFIPVLQISVELTLYERFSQQQQRRLC